MIPRPYQGHAAMLLFSALVAGSFSLGAKVGDLISPAAINAARFWIAAAIIAGIAMARGGVPANTFRAPWRYLTLGGLFSIYFVMMFEGLKTAAPVSAAAVFTLTPIMSGLFGWLLLRQVMTPRIAFALAVGGVGAVWVIFRGNIGALLSLDIGKGELIYFWGCVSHAIYTPMVRKLNRGESAFHFTLGMLLAGGLILTIWAWGDIRATDWAHLPAIVWITLFYTAIFASAATFVLLQFATLRLPSSKVMAYTYLTPSWVILWQLSLGEAAPSAIVLIGFAATIGALLLLLKE